MRKNDEPPTKKTKKVKYDSESSDNNIDDGAEVGEPVAKYDVAAVSYANSTQFSDWTFKNAEALRQARINANKQYCHDFREKLIECQIDQATIDRLVGSLISADDEKVLCKYIMHAGKRFADDFRTRDGDKMPESTRYIAYELFKRFFTKNSVMECSPQNLIIAAFFAATKIDEFYIPIHHFVRNLSTGTEQSNEKNIRALEPVLYAAVNYSLQIFLPYKPLNGYILIWKTIYPQQEHHILIDKFKDIANDFIAKSMLTDALLLHSPTHVSLASLLYAEQEVIKRESKEQRIISEYLPQIVKQYSAKDADTSQNIRHLVATLTAIIDLVLIDSEPVDAKIKDDVDKFWRDRFCAALEEYTNLTKCTSTANISQEEMFDSEDEW